MTSNSSVISPSLLARDTHLKMLDTLEHLLTKAKEHAEANKLDDKTVLDWRLHATMLPFRAQIIIATDILRRGLQRLAGQEPTPMEDGEASLDDYLARIAASRKVIAELSDEAIDASPDDTLTFPLGPQTRTMTRRDYQLDFIQPNLYFHVTAAYLILRQIGVPLGKNDFLLLPE